MKKILVSCFIVLCLVFGSLVFTMHQQNEKMAEAAVPVIDIKNIFETHMTYLEALQTAINTAIQIQHQIEELTRMNPETLIGELTGLTTEIGEIKKIMSDAKGILNTVQSAEDSWKKAFKSFENLGTNSVSDRIDNANNMLYHMDETYLDTLRMAKVNEQIEEDSKCLEKLLEEAQNAVGNKHVQQAAAGIEAQGVKAEFVQTQLLGAIAATLATQANYERTTREAAVKEAQKEIDAVKEFQSKGDPISSIRKGRF